MYQQGPSVVRAVSCIAKVEAPGARLQPPRMLRCALLHSPGAVLQSLYCSRRCCHTCSTNAHAAQVGRRLESALVPGQQRKARESSFSLMGHPSLPCCQMTCRIQGARACFRRSSLFTLYELCAAWVGVLRGLLLHQHSRSGWQLVYGQVCASQALADPQLKAGPPPVRCACLQV